ncbi:diacylglycerol/lipid kinase family protein [Parapedobacter deserti]|uniref:Diacylglycerol/lipid kinase family protein n=1 Tax=Parapedobacter deserti TaxID=1912957 RepID=A0ABV7JG83_9SPHI
MQKTKAGKHAHLFHNPKAGDHHHIKMDLIETVVSCGFTCKYNSTKAKGWGRIKNETALVVIAGGDGTVRQVMKKLLARKVLDKRLTVALLPAGTANNFAKTIGASASLANLGHTIAHWNPRPIDVGAIRNLRESKFFLEGMGCGLLPRLIKAMGDTDLSNVKSADEELDIALGKLVEIAQHYKPKWGQFKVDGVVYEDNYLLAEVLNIKSVGPNLELVPHADPSDGIFHVVLLKEADREAFIEYVQNLRIKAHRKASPIPWQLIEANRDIIIRSDNRLIHVDDELITVRKRQPFKIEIRAGIVDFLV